MDNYLQDIKKQQEFFNAGHTRNISFRKEQLGLLYHAVKSYEKDLADALHTDLHKSPFESYAAEIGFSLSEIRFLKKRLGKWAKPKRTRAAIVNFRSVSRVYPEPYGQSLVFSAWNYPVQLIFVPLAGSIAAGNTVILKPSEISPATAEVIREIISKTFPPEFIKCINGGVETGKALLDLPFNHIFFTGSPKIGKIIMENAAKKLIPVTLELGGKNPCIIDQSADLKFAAKKIVWGKFLNAGQTCIAPDYLLAHENIREKLLDYIKDYILKFYGEKPEESPDYCRIINRQNMERLEGLMDGTNIVFGGKVNKESNYISPTIVEEPPEGSPLMTEEIFGPVLPVVSYSEKQEAVDYANSKAKPLAMYVFSEDKKTVTYFLKNITSGNGAVNETLTQIANPYLPFGGINSSGIGEYHGEFSFRTFSHYKSILKKAKWPDLPFVYPPYSERGMKIIRKLLR